MVYSPKRLLRNGVPPYLHHGEQAELHRVLRFSQEVFLIFLLHVPEVFKERIGRRRAGNDRAPSND